MIDWHEFIRQQIDRGAKAARLGDGPAIVGRYGDFEAEYRALGEGPALVDRSYRSLLEIAGSDRAAWLHNLTTNEVKRLSPGEGNYAFALNVQGRIQFDLNLFIRSNVIWIDLDRRFLDRARKHFDKYTVTEDVRVIDRTGEFVRFALVGHRAKALLADSGVPHVANMPWFATAEFALEGCEVLALRNDFCGCFSVELLVPVAEAIPIWQRLVDPASRERATLVGDDAVQVRRIEAGIPWPFHEITDEYLPAETRQLDRAVSLQKGCYLGQEVVERMRSRDVVARQLVGLCMAGNQVPAVPNDLLGEDQKPIGTLTSVCRSPVLGGIGLGYVKTAMASAGTKVQIAGGDRVFQAVVSQLPFVPAPNH